MMHESSGKYTARSDGGATASSRRAACRAVLGTGLLWLAGAVACGGSSGSAGAPAPALPADRRPTGAGVPDSAAATAASAADPDTAAAAAAVEVRAALERSREALRALDVDAYLSGYTESPDLIVLDPAGEFVGREAFERYAREWFANARRLGTSYPIVTSAERVHALDGRTAVVTLHWSASGESGPQRSLIVYRRESEGWRIAAEQSGPLPEESDGGAPPDS
jgi:ketosteroid isomerase-like protein